MRLEAKTGHGAVEHVLYGEDGQLVGKYPTRDEALAAAGRQRKLQRSLAQAARASTPTKLDPDPKKEG